MKQFSFLIFSCILVCFAYLSFSSALRESLTFDEIVYLQEGRNAVLSHTFDIDPYNPPLTRELAMIPYLFVPQFYSSLEFAQHNPLPGRLMMLDIGLGLLVAVYVFARKHIGDWEALLATFLLAFEPDILAYSHYITMDIGVTLIFFLAYWSLVSLVKRPTLKKYCLFGFLTGVGMVTKITFMPFLFVSGAGVVMYQYIVIRKWQPKIHLQWLGVAVGIMVVVVWGAYFFKSSVIIKERPDTSRVSEKLLAYAKVHHTILLTSTIEVAKTQPLPLGDFLATLKNNALRSVQRESCFFYGTYYPSCLWYFMLGNLALKLPLPLLLLSGIGLFVGFLQKKKQTLLLPFTIPIASILVVVSLTRMQPLVRYVLPMYPFLILIAAFGTPFWFKSTIRKVFLGVLLLWYVVSSLSVYPHFISYANELTGIGVNKSFLLTDSNLDWGQALPDIAVFHRIHPQLEIYLSYFGRDNGDRFGLESQLPYGSYKKNDICAFHAIPSIQSTASVSLISISNWYMCGYYQQKIYAKKQIKGVLGNSFLVF